MNLKNTIIAQIVLLLAVLTFGGMLDGDITSDGLRTMHRVGSMLAALVAIVSIVMSFKAKQNSTVKALVIAAFVSVFIAAFAGSELSGSDNYSAMFNIMRGGGLVALLATVASLVAHSKSAKAAKQK